jgi:hypothetical protein
MDIESLMTDSAKESEGVWVPIGGDAEIKEAREGNEHYQDYLHGLVTANRAALDQNDKASRDLQRKLLIRAYAHTILKDVRGLKRGGKPIEAYTTAIGVELLTMHSIKPDGTIVEPEYPPELERRGIEGSVVVLVAIGLCCFGIGLCAAGLQTSGLRSSSVLLPLMVACAGLVSGSSTFQNSVNRLAPSSSAASSNSGGMARKYCVIKNTPNDPVRLGRISPG